MRGDKNQPNDSQKSDGLWDGSNENNNLYMEADWGNKAIINNTESTDLVAEADITLTEVNPGTDGNMGLIIRGSNYLENVDGADAVSYTHLDVYKRQASPCGVCCAKGGGAAYTSWIAGRILSGPGYKRLSFYNIKRHLCGLGYRV